MDHRTKVVPDGVNQPRYDSDNRSYASITKINRPPVSSDRVTSIKIPDSYVNVVNSGMTSTSTEPAGTFVSTNSVRQQKFIVGGKSKTASLKTASRSPKKAAVFVSRLDQSTQSREVEDFLLDLNLTHLVCTKMKTKYNTYSSFHVEVLESELNILLDESVWPDGSIVTKFFGRLRRDQITESGCTISDPGEISSIAQND